MTEFVIAVDIGNSSLEFGVFPAAADPLECTVVQRIRIDRATLDFEALNGLTAANAIWRVASVNREAESHLLQWLKQQDAQVQLQQLQHGDFGLAIELEHPERVGADRLAAAAAAAQLRQAGRAALVVDSGTALTVDLVSAKGAFQGGAIMPGVEMTAKALALHTDLLPQVGANAAAPQVVGDSTVAAIHSGLFWGSLGAIRELLDRMKAELDHAPDVFVTGGATPWLSYLKHATHVPDLVLRGIALAGRSKSGGEREQRG